MTQELLQVLHPRAYEPKAKRDLRTTFYSIIQGRANKAAAVEVLGEVVLNAFLGGKLQATRQLKQRHSILHREDFDVMEGAKIRYVQDFNGILSNYNLGKEKLQKSYARLEVMGQVAVWQLYNLGKVSRFREYDLEVRRSHHAQEFGHVEVATAADCCEKCRAKRGVAFSLWGVLPDLPFHPGCRCELMYVPWKAAQTLTAGGIMVAVG